MNFNREWKMAYKRASPQERLLIRLTLLQTIFQAGMLAVLIHVFVRLS